MMSDELCRELRWQCTSQLEASAQQRYSQTKYQTLQQ